MRKDTILGMSIGGIVLAIVVVYLTISPSQKQKTVVQLDTTGAAEVQGDNDPQPASDRGNESTGPSLARPTAHTGTGAGGSDATGSVDVTPGSTTAGNDGGQGDRPDTSGWHERLYGRSTPLIAVGQTPGNRPEAARGGEQPSGPTPVRESVAMLDRPQPAPGEISTGSLGTNTPAVSPTTHPAGVVATGNGKFTPHRVQPGETFSSIALTAYGSASYFPHILRANPGLDPRKLKPGMTINLPLESQVKPAEAPVTQEVLAAVAPGMPVTTLVPPVGKPAPAALDRAKEYQVKGGDNLNRISLKLYGKISMVGPLYEANKATIGPDMAKLKLGMVLKLPEAPTVKP